MNSQPIRLLAHVKMAAWAHMCFVGWQKAEQSSVYPVIYEETGRIRDV